jgi:hypothetical protein
MEAAIHKEVLLKNEKNEKDLPCSPGGEGHQIPIFPLDQTQDITHKNESIWNPVEFSSPCPKNKAGNHSLGWGNEIIVSKSDSPQIQFFSELQNNQKIHFCLPEMIKKNDQNVGLMKKDFTYKSVYKAENKENCQTSKILAIQQEKPSDMKDVRFRKDEASSNNIIHKSITGWGNPMLTDWNKKKENMLENYKMNQKKQMKTTIPGNQTTLKEKIIDARIVEALNKHEDFQKRLELVNKPIEGKNQSKKDKIKNKEKLLIMTNKLKSALQIKKIITINNPWTCTKYNKTLCNDHFWLQKNKKLSKSPHSIQYIRSAKNNF